MDARQPALETKSCSNFCLHCRGKLLTSPRLPSHYNTGPTGKAKRLL
jgi:hypothetical protein